MLGNIVSIAVSCPPAESGELVRNERWLSAGSPPPPSPWGAEQSGKVWDVRWSCRFLVIGEDMPGIGDSMRIGGEAGTLGKDSAWERPARPDLLIQLVLCYSYGPRFR